MAFREWAWAYDPRASSVAAPLKVPINNPPFTLTRYQCSVPLVGQYQQRPVRRTQHSCGPTVVAQVVRAFISKFTLKLHTGRLLCRRQDQLHTKYTPRSLVVCERNLLHTFLVQKWPRLNATPRRLFDRSLDSSTSTSSRTVETYFPLCPWSSTWV